MKSQKAEPSGKLTNSATKMLIRRTISEFLR